MSTPLVAAEAKRLGVDPATVTGTGIGGRTTLADVRAAAPPRPPQPAARPMLRPAPLAHASASRGEAWTNPILATLRATDRGAVARAERLSPAPAMFGSGSTPSFTASGAPPAHLLDLPPEVRHAAAAAATGAQALALHDQYAGPGGRDAARSARTHPGYLAYEQRMSAWLAAAHGPTVAAALMMGGTAADGQVVTA